MSNIDKQALRERYSEKPAPKCHICWSVMTIQRAGAGSVVYGCTGRIDEDGEGYKFAEGRDFADDHYARSRVTEYSPGGDPDVLALLDELETKEEQRANWFQMAQKLGEDLDAAEKRLAELEARTVCLPKLPVLGSTAEWYEGFAAGASGMRNECADAIRAAGIGVKGE
ncbi:ead/Ea22-like family protein [Citrobacter freundii]